ncbi:E3 ubiquitin-protein ligase TRIM71-like [Haliotis rufescens]|uniref:E3 ubiquitin-protein ligase TRIM71-like n=1 Tax=Haliotis rufescens TaxID=6454 RepID=UPI00201F5C72|nr:E3 ubiquitin-protein ligase TRIM71-like [Haliotis rufescens]
MKLMFLGRMCRSSYRYAPKKVFYFKCAQYITGSDKTNLSQPALRHFVTLSRVQRRLSGHKMAAARKLESLNENFLTCSICTEGYKDPCTLTCGHTFCKGCLGKFLKTRQDAIRAKSISCPYCRQMTRVPQPDKPVGEWVKQIKPSFLIQGLLDTLACGGNTDHDTENRCHPCQDFGESHPANSYCQDCDVPLCERCVKMHASLPCTSNHVIADLGGAVKVTRRQKCAEHNEVMDFCCKDCNKAICHKCCVICHRKCDSVVTFQSMMSEMRSVLTHNKGLITQSFDDMGRSLQQHKSQIDAISHNKDKIKSQIRQASQKALAVIKQKEKQLLEELNEMTEKQSGQMRGRIKSGEIDMQMYQQYIEYITQVLKSGSETDMFDIYQMCQSGAIKEATDRDVTFTDSVRDSKLIFVSEINERILHKDVKLGRIKPNVCDVMDTQLGKIQSGTFDVMCRPVLHKTVGIKVDGDREQPDPYDVTVLVVDGEETLVVTDNSNTCLKSFYTKNNISRCSKLDLASKPSSVTRLGNNQVAVSYRSHNEIVIVRVTPDLVLQSRVTTKKKYTCLTALSPSTLAAGCWDPSCVDILDVSGKVMRSVSTFNTGKNLMRYPSFLCATDRGNILVSDAGLHSVCYITPEGDVVFTYTPTGGSRLVGPQSITTTSTGHILVADYWAHKVILMTPAGEFVRDLLTSQDGLQDPYGLMYCDCKLYVAECYGDAVKVFNCSIPQ